MSEFDSDRLRDAVAIVAMAGRFPGANSVEAFWNNLVSGRDAIGRYRLDELKDSISAKERARSDYVPVRPRLDGVEDFDAALFEMKPREAEVTDPQQRLFLELCWDVMERAGYGPRTSLPPVGVFAGASPSTYHLRHVLQDRASVENFTSGYQVENYTEMVGGGSDFVATKVSYKLGLTGPSMTVLSACSTSLLATAQACQSLQMFQCDMALAGGLSITFPQERGYFYTEDGMVSPDGKCRPYDHKAAGTVFGHGAGVVLLKRYEDAIADGDEVVAVISGYGITNDGRDKVGYSAPSVKAQADAIRMAVDMAAIDPAEITYIEGHGTATPLGDPIEVAALHSVFGEGADGAAPCYVGSVKANVGHLDAAAGVTGLIKAAQAVHSGYLPPLVNFEEENPRIRELGKTRLRFVGEGVDLKREGVAIRAGVNALGVGGTNVHIIVEPAETSRGPAEARRGEQGDTANSDVAYVLPLSAKSPAALGDMAERLADALAKPDAPSLLDTAHTLQVGRAQFEHRAAVAAVTPATAIEALKNTAKRVRAGAPWDGALRRRQVWMFPGQGAQYPQMAQGLYESDETFRAVADEGFAIAQEVTGTDLKTVLFSADGGEKIRNTVLAQPALFVVEYALARHMMAVGASPDAMVGHSLGEFVAAALSGVFSFEDGLRIVCARAKAMADRPSGAMLSVRLPVEDLRARLPEDVDLAAVNGPKACVVAGPHSAIEAFAEALKREDIPYRALHTSHAFHSRMMDEAVAAIGEIVAGVTLSPPQIPIASSVSGDWMRPEEATSPNYWSRQCRAAVMFADAIATIGFETPSVFVEVGPGTTLTTLGGQVSAAQRRQYDEETHAPVFIATLPDFEARSETLTHVATAHAQLWQAGLARDWTKLAAARGRRVGLPSYPFQRKRYFIDVKAPADTALLSQGPHSAAQVNADVAQPCAMVAPALVAAAPTALPSAVPGSSPVGSISVPSSSETPSMSGETQRAYVLQAVLGTLGELTGEEFEGVSEQVTLVALGFDSLLLGQAAQKFNRQYGTNLSLRQFRTEITTVGALADVLAEHIEVPVPEVPVQPAPAGVINGAAPAAVSAAPAIGVQLQPAMQPGPVGVPAGPLAFAAPGEGGAAAQVFRDQLALVQNVIAQQIQALGQPGAPAAGPLPATAGAAAPQAAGQPGAVAPAARRGAGLTPLPELSSSSQSSRLANFSEKKSGSGELTAAQRSFVDDLVRRSNEKFGRSKSYTQRHRRRLADPRAASGFSDAWKELVYPLVVDRAKGALIHDLDGNALVDLVSGFGQNAFGHSPDFVNAAIAEQAERGYPIGPQSDLAGEVAEMLCEMTGNERATFCNTGSEAVMAAMRLARAVTARDVVVFFSGAYHGQFDEVLAKRGRSRSMPIAPGIPDDSLGNIVILQYDDPQSLAWVRENAAQIAAVIVEPVQSRRPGLVPTQFLRELRGVTQEAGTALVFDEVVTGFRTHNGGMQHVMGIRADMATYGKVLGGGMPIGVLAGRDAFMDALDGGQWQYGDQSIPEVAPTFFAGTFVRHPLVLAAAKAVLTHLKGEGGAALEKTAERALALSNTINDELASRGIAMRSNCYSSWFSLEPSKADPLGALYYPTMRLHGVHLLDGFACYMTTAHGEAEIAHVLEAFKATLDEMQGVGIFAPPSGGGTHVALPPQDRTSTAAGARAQGDSAPVAGSFAPTEAMREVYLAAQLSDAASCAFNEGLTVRLDGAVDVDALLRALNDLVARHPLLRAGFGESGEALVIPAEVKLDLAQVDVSDATDKEAALAALVKADQSTPFDLKSGPMFRATLVRLGAQSHALVLCGHHIVLDGWSASVVLSDLTAFYNAHVSGGKADLPPPAPIDDILRDVAGEGSAEEAYWVEQFKAVPDPLDLPSDRPRPPRKSFAGATYVHTFKDDLFGKVRQRSRSLGVTPFVMLFASVQALLSRMSGHEDVCTLVPMAGQLLGGREDAVAHQVNFLPIRSTFADQSLRAFVAETDKVLQAATANQDCTLGRIVRKLALSRRWDRTPLSDVQFNFETEVAPPEFVGIAAQVEVSPKAAVNFDLFFNIVATHAQGGGLRGEIDYSTDLFDEGSIAQLMSRLETLLGAIADAEPDASVASMPLLDQNEADWLLDGVNDTETEIDLSKPLYELISQTAQSSGAKTALICGDDKLTYAELEALSGRIAQQLAPMFPQRARIAVAVERSNEMVAVLLGVWKAGHVFIPLDPSHPVARLADTMQAGDVAGVISSDVAILAAAPAGVQKVQVDTLLQGEATPAEADALELVRTQPSEPAYIIFTSGSTGRPKGVEVSHGALVNFMQSMARAPGLSADDQLIAVTTVCFDIALLELFGPLMAGGTVLIAKRADVLDGFALADMIERTGSTVMQATPSLWQMMLEADFSPPPGFRILSGGEPLARDVAYALRSKSDVLWNMYGPTETTIWSSIAKIVDDGPITVGRPIANTSMVIVDRDDQLVPAGVEGDLLIGGTGLANGYFGRPDLTEAAFAELSLAGRAPQRFYRTGDRAVRAKDGQIVLKGRRDQQVKLRGFRIELEEIEAAMREADGVAAAAAAVLEDGAGERRIVGFYVGNDGQQVQASALVQVLKARLPDYMVPTAWRSVSELPRTANGKLDRKQLPSLFDGAVLPGGAREMRGGAAAATSAATAAANAQSAGAEAAASPVNFKVQLSQAERDIAEVWEDVLGRQIATPEADLFSLGADSLHLFRIAARLKRKGMAVDAAALFENPTVGELAARVGTIVAAEASVAAGPKLSDYAGGNRRAGRGQ